MTTPRPVIFLAFANDRVARGEYLRNLNAEQRRVRDVLLPLTANGSWEIVERSNATLNDILSVFQSAEYRNRVAIFHYAGHANGYQLLLESETGDHAPALATGLSAFLANQLGLQLVVLNACATRAQAHGLLHAGVASVVATGSEIEDAAGTEFAVGLYRGLAGGASLRTAFAEATSGIIAESKFAQRKAVRVDVPADGGTQWPWDLYPDGGEQTEWTLGDLANDPYFSLPALPSRELPASPYVHLRWFDRAHAEVFFGRARDVRSVLSHLTDADAAPIVLLYGQSGAGKSSLLEAGILPRLHELHDVEYVRRDAASGLTETLARAIGGEAATIAERWKERERGGRRPFTMVLDQVEEAFTRPHQGGADGELRNLAAALHGLFADASQQPVGKLILGFRKEWLAEIDARIGDQRLRRTYRFVERLDRESVIEIVAGPTRVARLLKCYRLEIEPGLPELIADDLLEDPGSPIAPVLQILLSRMWESATHTSRSKPRFDRATYQRLKTQGLLLDDFLEAQIGALHAWQSDLVDSGFVLDYLHAHTTDLGTSRECAPSELERRYAHRTDALPALRQKSLDLFVLAEPPGETPSAAGTESVTRLAHDTLAPLVRRRFDLSMAPGQRARRLLESRSTEWNEAQSGTAFDDEDLARVEAGANGMRARTIAEARLVAASVAARHTRRKHDRILRASLTTVLVALVITSGVALVKSRSARRSTAVVEGHALAALSREQVPQNLDEALLLAVAAIEKAPAAAEARRALFNALDAAASVKYVLRTPETDVVAVSPDGRWLASGGDGPVVLWDLDKGLPRDTLTEETSNPFELTFSPDSRKLFVGKYHEILSWDLQSGSKLDTVLHVPGLWRDSVEVMDISANTKFAVYRRKQSVIVRSLDKSPGDESPPSVAIPLLTSDWRRLDDYSMTVSPDGRYVVLLKAFQQANGRLLDVQQRRVVFEFPSANQYRPRAVFGPDGRYFAALHPDGHYMWYNVAQPRSIGAVIPGNKSGPVTASADGRRFFVAIDGLLLTDPDHKDPFEGIFWTNPPSPRVLLKTGLQFESVAADRLGRRVAAATESGVTFVLEPPAQLVFPPPSVSDSLEMPTSSGAVRAVSADGSRVVFLADPRMLDLWDLRRRSRLALLGPSHAPVEAVSLSSSGAWLAFYADSRVVVLDVRQPGKPAIRWSRQLRIADEDRLIGNANIAVDSAGRDVAVLLQAGRTFIVHADSTLAIDTVPSIARNSSVLSFLPEGGLLQGSWTGVVTTWTRRAPKRLDTLHQANTPVGQVAVSLSGRWAAAEFFDHATWIWKIETKELFATLDASEAESYEFMTFPTDETVFRRLGRSLYPIATLPLNLESSLDRACGIVGWRRAQSTWARRAMPYSFPERCSKSGKN